MDLLDKYYSELSLIDLIDKYYSEPSLIDLTDKFYSELSRTKSYKAKSYKHYSKGSKLLITLWRKYQWGRIFRESGNKSGNNSELGKMINNIKVLSL
jgi:hypothetical protein